MSFWGLYPLLCFMRSLPTTWWECKLFPALCELSWLSIMVFYTMNGYISTQRPQGMRLQSSSVSVLPIQGNSGPCLGFSSWGWDLETASTENRGDHVAHSTCLPSLRDHIVLHGLLPNVLKQLFHIFWPVPSCLQWESNSQALLPHGRDWKPF